MISWEEFLLVLLYIYIYIIACNLFTSPAATATATIENSFLVALICLFKYAFYFCSFSTTWNDSVVDLSLMHLRDEMDDEGGVLKLNQSAALNEKGCYNSCRE